MHGLIAHRRPLLAEVASDDRAMMTPSLREEDLEVGEDFFIWPHPMNSSEALFVVDDVAELATREAASRSYEGIWATLSKMGHTIILVAHLGTEA